MPFESRIAPEDAAEMAAHATAAIDAALAGSGLQRDAYWAAVRKGYNTPYNDPPRRRAARPDAAASLALADAAAVPAVAPLAVVAMAALTVEIRAA